MLLLVVEGVLRYHFVEDDRKLPKEFELIFEMWGQSIKDSLHIDLGELIW